MNPSDYPRFMPTVRVMSEDKLVELLRSPKTTREIAFAHSRCDEHGNHICYIAMIYPVDYIVTDEQINRAKARFKKYRTKAFEKLGNTLTFVGMGMERKDGLNHRIRTYVIAPDGMKHFIELSFIDNSHEGKKPEWNIDHLIYNRKERGRSNQRIAYKRQAVINLVNNEFGCKFTKMRVDQYILNPFEYASISPK